MHRRQCPIARFFSSKLKWFLPKDPDASPTTKEAGDRPRPRDTRPAGAPAWNKVTVPIIYDSRILTLAGERRADHGRRGLRYGGRFI